MADEIEGKITNAASQLGDVRTRWPLPTGKGVAVEYGDHTIIAYNPGDLPAVVRQGRNFDPGPRPDSNKPK